MSVAWHDPKVKLPEDGDECLLLPHQQGLVTSHVYGPILWRAETGGGVWLDIFATPEAGEIIRPAQVSLWTLWDPIAPPEEADDV
jgi:hypothetical protein